jgi:hypothetical protein
MAIVSSHVSRAQTGTSSLKVDSIFSFSLPPPGSLPRIPTFFSFHICLSLVLLMRIRLQAKLLWPPEQVGSVAAFRSYSHVLIIIVAAAAFSSDPPTTPHLSPLVHPPRAADQKTNRYRIRCGSRPSKNSQHLTDRAVMNCAFLHSTRHR